jgi:16S rRNA (guanine527-N7)-methyltransferase
VEAKLGSLLERAASEMACPLDTARLDLLASWLERLEEWNARTDLTAARSREELVDLMVGDALVMSQRVASGARLIDVGTGAGAPGLALALLRPDLAVTLVEPLGKRVSFLRTVVGAARRTDIAIERARGDAFAGRRQWDVAVSRATLAPAAWLDLGVRLVRPAGEVWALLAKEAPPEAPTAALADDFTYVWPLTRAERRAALYRVA